MLSPRVTVEVATSLSDVAAAWDDLVDLVPRPNPFLRSWWLGALVTDTTRFVLVRDGAQLVGGAAFTLDRRRRVTRCRFLGSGPLAPHALDVVSMPGREDAVGRAVGRWLVGAARVVDLQGIDGAGTLAHHVPVHAARVESDRAPWIEVPASFEDYLSARPRKLRQEIRRVQRRLGERGIRHRVVAADDAGRALDTFLALHSERWSGASLLLPRLEALAVALRAGSRAREVVFTEVVAAERVVASLVMLELGNRSYWYQMGRDPNVEWSNVGTLLKSVAVERSCDLGHEAIDLCVGNAPTKRVWADEDRPVTRIVWVNGALGRPLTRVLERLVARTRG